MGSRLRDDRLWLARKFSNLLALSGNASIDTNWTEMLTVEVGLWTVIHRVYVTKKKGECFNSVVLVRCDHTGVVKAIENRHSSFQPQQKILQRIIDMVDEYNIELAMKWVPSINNLADNPSRGAPSHGMTLLPFIPLLPSYLSNALNPVSHCLQKPQTPRQRRRKGPRCYHRTALEYDRPDPLEGFFDADNYIESYYGDSD